MIRAKHKSFIARRQQRIRAPFERIAWGDKRGEYGEQNKDQDESHREVCT
jgi:hypothetical protein